MEIIFTIILFLNIPIAVTAFFFAYILLKRSKGNPIYFNFGMANLFLGLWAITIFLLFNPLFTGVLFINLSFLFGVWIMHYFLIFSYVFPFSKSQNSVKVNIFYFLTILISASIFMPGLYATKTTLDYPYLYVNHNFIGLTIFLAYFAFISFIALKNLIVKYFHSDGVFKAKLKGITISAGIAILVNIVVNISIFYLIEFDTAPVGVLFASGVLFYIYLVLFRD